MLAPPRAGRPASPLKSLLEGAPRVLLAPVPLALLQPIFNRIATMCAHSRPELFNRLGPHAGKRFLIDPIDLPFVLVLPPDPSGPSHRASPPRAARASYARDRRHVLQPARHDRRHARRRRAVFLARSARERRHRSRGGAAQRARRFRGRGARQHGRGFGPLSGPAALGAVGVALHRREMERATNDHALRRRPELVCPAGTPAALRTAVDAGADAVYCGLQNETNARNFPGLNFTPRRARTVARLRACAQGQAAARGQYVSAGRQVRACGSDAIDDRRQARRRRGDRRRHGGRRLRRAHLSATCGCICRCRPAPRRRRRSASIANEFGVKRVVLPRMLTVAEIAEMHRQIPARSKPSSSAISA